MDWVRVLSITCTGMLVVFIGLILLITIMLLMGKIGKTVSKKEKSLEVEPSPDLNMVENKKIATIMAAICAYTDDKSFRIKSIEPVVSSKPKRSPWNLSGILKETKPF